MLFAFVAENLRDWDEHINLLMMVYRSSSHEFTGVSPCEMVLGRNINLPVYLVLGRVEPKMSTCTDYTTKPRKIIDKVHEFVRDKITLSTHTVKPIQRG
ncbi:hypothetical protein CI610_03121 [invertebrate metagenome]|uniref:Integrase catalytic domain-containing protein n=1 Tax=invertebrate metagenome TaxID=1711999 RepID=A0A2H9T3Y8_9ZZZZ